MRTLKGVLLTFFLLTSCLTLSAQTIGSKKNITLKLVTYQCGDECYLELKDVATGKVFSFENVDDKSKGQDVFTYIQDTYYNNGESDKKLVGKLFKAIIEYRYKDIMVQTSPDEAPKKTGKKKLQWMINSISR